MKRAGLASVAILVSMSSAGFAQTSPSATNNPTASAKVAANGTEAKGAGNNFQQRLTTDLQQAGFTNIKIIPQSFLLQATDKSGNPVTMFLSPHSMTVVSDIEPNGQNAQAGDDGGMFVRIPATSELSSKVIGLDVYNAANQSIGKIKDVAFDANGLKGYILGVGGFIGMGEHHVAARPSAITLNYNASEKKWHAATNINADQLKAAPDAITVEAQPSVGGMFTSIQSKDDLNSQLIGLGVYNTANENIGTIKDVAFDATGVKAYIVGVGGHIGLGEHYVAVRPSAITLNYNAGEKKWHAALDVDADQLKTAPEFKYSDNA